MDGPGHESSLNAPARIPTQEVTEKSRSPSTYLWAMLLARIYEVFPLLCLRCGETMRIIGFITDVGCIQRILEHIGEPTYAPPPPPAIHPRGRSTSMRAGSIRVP